MQFQYFLDKFERNYFYFYKKCLRDSIPKNNIRLLSISNQRKRDQKNLYHSWHLIYKYVELLVIVGISNIKGIVDIASSKKEEGVLLRCSTDYY